MATWSRLTRVLADGLDRVVEGVRSFLLRPPAGNADVMIATSLVRAAEIAAESGRRSEALAFYGRAIDAYLKAGLTHQAEAVCRTIIATEPDVLRTRYTLAAIAVGRGRARQAAARLADYMAAVERVQAAAQAIPSLLDLAAATSDPGLRDVLGKALNDAGRPDLGQQVILGVAATPDHAGWDRAVLAAVTKPEEVDVEALTAPSAGFPDRGA
jgi:predicted Zn-dependent protease